MKLLRLWLYACLLYGSFSFATPQTSLAISLQDAPLSATLLFIANALKINIMLSPNISGMNHIHFVNANPQQALTALLQMHGLAMQIYGDVYYVAPYAELLKRQEESRAWANQQNTLAPREMAMWRLQYAKVEDVASIISQPAKSLLSKRAVLQVDKRTNMLLIKDTPQAIEKAKAVVKQLDVPVPQIMITARLVSIDKDCEQELGLQFSRPYMAAAKKTGSESGPVETIAAMAAYPLAIFKMNGKSLLDIKLAALENAGRAKLISNPRLFTANQQSASIEAGEEIPYQEVSESGGTATSFKRAVLGLQVTPQILPGGKVLLQLKINQDRISAKLIQGVPTISTRQISTQIVVQAGQTLILGGIYEENREAIMQGIPYINQIPVVGWLFKQQQTRISKRELLIFVTPTIIK